MLRSLVSRVAWVGRTVSTVFGLALVLALAVGTISAAFGATGDGFILGQGNVADAITRLTGNVSGGPALQVVNNSAANGSRALQLGVADGKPPLTVGADAGKATNLNADELDGLDSGALMGPRGYAHVMDEGGVDPLFPSRGVNGVVIPQNQTSLYCFDLAFTPKVAVGSPYLTNNAVVATVTPPNSFIPSACAAPYRDAAAKTYGANSSADVPINFQIMFE